MFKFIVLKLDIIARKQLHYINRKQKKSFHDKNVVFKIGNTHVKYRSIKKFYANDIAEKENGQFVEKQNL